MSDTNRLIAGRHSHRWRPFAFRFALLLACVVLWGGCSVKKHYKLLSFFFDGVPDPNAPVKPAGESDAVSAVGKAKLPTLSVHRPYAENKCGACHKGEPSAIFESSALNSDVCMECHRKVLTGYPLMHAPVASKACLWCHNPHDSPQPALLREPTPTVCTQCHEKQLLGPKPPEHLLPDSRCLDCHQGHGGTKRYFVRSELPPPAARPSSRPTTAPSGGGAT